MKARNKALLLVLCAVALVASSILGTLAYLTSRDTVTNTFTVGSVHIALDEAKVNEDGTYVTDHDNRVKENKYHLLPGHTYYKDPTVTVQEGSEDAYVRMIVRVENFASLESAIPAAYGAEYYADLNGDGNPDFVLEKLLNNTWNYEKWHFAGYSEDGTTSVYEFRYHTIVEDKTVLEDLFEEIKVPGELTNTDIEYLKNVKIVVNANAIQADGFATADLAWDAFDKQNNA